MVTHGEMIRYTKNDTDCGYSSKPAHSVLSHDIYQLLEELKHDIMNYQT